jgi:hypothetical protein
MRDVRPTPTATCAGRSDCLCSQHGMHPSLLGASKKRPFDLKVRSFLRLILERSHANNLICMLCFADCDSGCRGFESHQPPQNQELRTLVAANFLRAFYCWALSHASAIVKPTHHRVGLMLGNFRTITPLFFHGGDSFRTQVVKPEAGVARILQLHLQSVPDSLELCVRVRLTAPAAHQMNRFMARGLLNRNVAPGRQSGVLP